jgi:hypothetical protein
MVLGLLFIVAYTLTHLIINKLHDIPVCGLLFVLCGSADALFLTMQATCQLGIRKVWAWTTINQKP